MYLMAATGYCSIVSSIQNEEERIHSGSLKPELPLVDHRQQKEDQQDKSNRLNDPHPPIDTVIECIVVHRQRTLKAARERIPILIIASLIKYV